MTKKILTLKGSRKKFRKNFRKIFFTHNSWYCSTPLAKKLAHNVNKFLLKIQFYVFFAFSDDFRNRNIAVWGWDNWQDKW